MYLLFCLSDIYIIRFEKRIEYIFMMACAMVAINIIVLLTKKIFVIILLLIFGGKKWSWRTKFGASYFFASSYYLFIINLIWKNNKKLLICVQLLFLVFDFFFKFLTIFPKHSEAYKMFIMINHEKMIFI